MTDDAIRAAIAETAMEIFELERDEVAQDASFESDLGVDSLQKLEFITQLERRFGMRYTAAEGSRMDSLSDAFNLTEQHLAK